MTKTTDIKRMGKAAKVSKDGLWQKTLTDKGDRDAKNVSGGYLDAKVTDRRKHGCRRSSFVRIRRKRIEIPIVRRVFD